MKIKRRKTFLLRLREIQRTERNPHRVYTGKSLWMVKTCEIISIDFTVGRRVLRTDSITGRLAVVCLSVQLGTFHQVVQIAVVGAIVQHGVPKL